MHDVIDESRFTALYDDAWCDRAADFSAAPCCGGRSASCWKCRAPLTRVEIDAIQAELDDDKVGQ